MGYLQRMHHVEQVKDTGFWHVGRCWGKQKVNSKYVKAVANHYYCNLYGLRSRLEMRLKIFSVVL